MQAQHPIENRQRERRWLMVLSAVLVAAACQASEVLNVLPGNALTANARGGFQPPTNVTATPLSFSQVRVTWTDVSPNEAGFQVFRSATTGAAVVYTSGPNVTSWTDSGLTASTSYCYKVRAFRENGSNQTYSDYSAFSCVITPAPPPPPPPPPAPPGAPDQVYAEPVDSVTIRLTWRDGSSNEDGFRVERSVANGTTWTTVGTVAPNVLSFTQNDPLAEQGVCYRVIAFNVVGDSPPDYPNCAVPPAAPTNFGLTVTAPGEIELSWTDNSSVESHYEVWVAYGDPCCVICNAAGWYEYPIAALPANTTRFRTMLESTACQTIYVYVAASVDWSMRTTETLAVPPRP
jgi:hypothetical protein